MESEKPNLPSLQVNVPAIAEEVAKPLIADDKIVNYFEEVIENLREDRKEAHDQYLNFADMAVNSDGSSATKEAMVNLLRIKTEATDKMIKILDIWTKTRQKEKETVRYVTVNQNNKIENKASRKTIEQLLQENK